MKTQKIENLTLNSLLEGNLSKKETQREFAKVYNAFRKPLMSFLNKMGIVYDDAEDVLNEAMVKAFNSLNTYNSNYKFSTWLYSITKNMAIDHLRKKTIKTTSLDEFYDSNDGGKVKREDVVISTELISDKLMQKQNRAEICRLIVSKLSNEKVRECIELRYFKEFSLKEIAEHTNLPIGSVKNYIFKGQKLMLDYCKEHNIENIL